MKASELIIALQCFPPNVPVVAEWDSGWANLEIPQLERDENNNLVLVFDVNEYGTYQDDSGVK
jgi:hypothetical protein